MLIQTPTGYVGVFIPIENQCCAINSFILTMQSTQSYLSERLVVDSLCCVRAACSSVTHI